jgi:hypothetical protein
MLYSREQQRAEREAEEAGDIKTGERRGYVREGGFKSNRENSGEFGSIQEQSGDELRNHNYENYYFNGKYRRRLQDVIFWR